MIKKIICLSLFLMVALLTTACHEKENPPKPSPKHQKKTEIKKYTIDSLQKHADAEKMLPVVFKIKALGKNKQKLTLILAIEESIYQNMKKINSPYFYTFSTFKGEALDFKPVNSNKIRILSDSEITNNKINKQNSHIVDETYVFLQITQEGSGKFHENDRFSFAFLSERYEDVFYFADLKQQVSYFKEAE